LADDARGEGGESDARESMMMQGEVEGRVMQGKV